MTSVGVMMSDDFIQVTIDNFFRAITWFLASLSLLLDQIPATFWSDVAKALIGSFVGAGLAFAFALRRDRMVRIRDQKGAGNLAMAIIARQLSDFLNLRFVLEEYRRTILSNQPNLPLWMQMKPTTFLFSDSLRFNIGSLTFLFEHKETNILERLMNAEILYHDLAMLIQVYSAAAEQAQLKLSESMVLTAGAPIGNVEKVVGDALVNKLNSLVTAIFHHLASGEKTFLDAANDLHADLVKQFGLNGVISVKKPDIAGLHRSQAPA